MSTNLLRKLAQRESFAALMMAKALWTTTSCLLEKEERKTRRMGQKAGRPSFDCSSPTSGLAGRGQPQTPSKVYLEGLRNFANLKSRTESSSSQAWTVRHPESGEREKGKMRRNLEGPGVGVGVRKFRNSERSSNVEDELQFQSWERGR